MLVPRGPQPASAWRLPATAVESRVLLVEDDPFDASVMQRALNKLGFATIAVPTLGEAVLRLRNEVFALVVLDLSLPDAVAGQALTTLEEVAGGIPIVVVSGASDVLERLQHQRGRRWHLLDKGDLELGMLGAVIRHALGGRPGGASAA